LLEIEEEEEEKKIELYSVGDKIEHFNKIMLQNNIANFHKSTTVASACFRQIKKPIQIEFNELDVIGIIYFFLLLCFSIILNIYL
jgi:hypothetical protein